MSTESTYRIENEAGRWLARRDAGDWSSADDQAFDAWMNASMAHSVAYWRLQDAWESAVRLKALGAGVQADEPPAPGKWNVSPFFEQPQAESVKHQRNLGLRALAAGLALAAVAGMAWYFASPGDSFETPVGAVASLPIDDGSTITLNTDSKIKVAISATERRIDLTHGEAFFEVAKDPTRPFVVTVGDKRVIAVGTSFSVRKGLGQTGEDIQVVVTDGAVRIESAGGDAQKGAEALLPAGTIARTTGGKLLVEHKALPETQEELSWRSGILIFRNTTLADAVAEFNRYNKRKILIEDPAVAALTIAGNFRSTNLDSFVEIIEKGYPVRVNDRGGDFVVSAER